MADSDAGSKSRLERFDLCSNRLLKIAETWAVLILVCLIWIVAIPTVIWIALSPTTRLALVLGNMSVNWRAYLLLAVPIFYRTLIAILERMKRFPFGEPKEADEEPAEGKKTHNPPEREKDA
jgi:hypothetical protein